jgi:hypothetical protein
LAATSQLQLDTHAGPIVVAASTCIQAVVLKKENNSEGDEFFNVKQISTSDASRMKATLEVESVSTSQPKSMFRSAFAQGEGLEKLISVINTTPSLATEVAKPQVSSTRCGAQLF